MYACIYFVGMHAFTQSTPMTITQDSNTLPYTLDATYVLIFTHSSLSLADYGIIGDLQYESAIV